MIQSSSYNSQSQGLVERFVGILKEQLKMSRSSLSQFQIDELVFAINSRETSQGSALARFLGRGLRQRLPRREL